MVVAVNAFSPTRSFHTCRQIRYFSTIPRNTSIIATMSIPSSQTVMNLDENVSDFSDRATENKEWIDVQNIRNALTKNHFLDILEIHGSHFGLKRDDEYEGHDAAGSFSVRMMKLSTIFRFHVIGAFARRVGFHNVSCISDRTVHGSASYERIATLKAIQRKEKLIVGAVVGDEERRIRARIPLLIRMDVAVKEFGIQIPTDTLEKDPSSIYISMGMKRRQIETYNSKVMRKSSLNKMQTEMWLWNSLLADAQGCNVRYSLLMGLHPKREKPIEDGARPKDHPRDENGLHGIFDTRIWKVGIIKYSSPLCERGESALNALRWRVNVQDYGRDWAEDSMKRFQEEGKSCCDAPDVNPIYALSYFASDVRLRPNMKCASMYDYPWSAAKQKLAEDLCELTLVSGVSQEAVAKAIANNIPLNYNDEKITTTILGVKSNFTKQSLIKVKPDYQGPLVTPSIIPHNQYNWRRLQNFNERKYQTFDKDSALLEMAEERTFYVDFELASPDMLYPAEQAEFAKQNLNSGLIQHARFFDTQPRKPIQSDMSFDSYIFMIGCGQVINGEWKHKVFIADDLTVNGESKIFRDWFLHMYSLIPGDYGPPLIYVWGPEQKLMGKTFSRMKQEDKLMIKEFNQYKIVNMLRVVQSSCLSIKGSLSNSVKSVSVSLGKLGLLEDVIGRPDLNLVQNGCDAMALGLDSAQIALEKNLPTMALAPKMKFVAVYNEVDCLDIAKIVLYLQKNH